MIFQILVMILPHFFDFERPYLSSKTKIKKSEAVVARNMMNKCAKFHKDSLDMKMKVLRTNSAQSSVIDTEESRHNQRKDQFVSLTRCFTTQQVDRQRQ